MSLLGSRGKGMAWSGVMVRLKCCGNVSMFKWLCNVSNLIISCLVHKIP